ncbi:MAG: HAMP domain-containing protein [Ardenticatenaceae bacterium]|nr:HAMP domain-containing protein [Ardenticatenaceae bacterium]
MNRLWVRLSLTFSAVVLSVFLILAVTMQLNPGAPDSLPEGLELSPAEEEAIRVLEESETIQRFSLQARRVIVPVAVTYVAVITGGAAIVAGVWMSRRLTRPLSGLQTAAHAIGRNDLSYRVDITGTEEMADVARAFNQMAAQLQQAESLRRNLLADVAHELRHPLHVIAGNLRAILDDVYPLSKEEIGRLLEQTHHLTKLVSDLHELAQAEARQLPLHRRVVDVAALVKETAVAFQPTAQAQGIILQVELLGALPQLAVDTDRIRQVVNNLVVNALRHTGANGRITLSIEQKEKALEVRVHDTGAGIAPENLPYVFERFYRTDGARSRDEQGTGLGLAIVKALVEAHGGGVTAVSPGLGQGSTFTFSLPR